MSRRLVLVGAGGFFRETVGILRDFNRASRPSERFQVVGVADSPRTDAELVLLERLGIPFLGSDDALIDSGRDAEYLVCVGDPGIRRTIVSRMDEAGFSPATLVHPNAVVGPLSQIGAGAIVAGGVVISTNVSIGRHVHVNPSATIGHDSRIDEFASLNPGSVVSGGCHVEAAVMLGAGCVILENLVVGAGATVGAAACVTKSVEPRKVVVGIPARVHAGSTR